MRRRDVERLQRDVALLALSGVVVAVASLDIQLIRHGHRSLSSTIRARMALRVAVTVLWLHLVTKLPFDPLTYIGDKIMPSRKL